MIELENPPNLKLTSVQIREHKHSVIVPISSSKPVIPDEVKENWQRLIDLTAQLIQVPSSLIMRLEEDYIEVFLKSNTEGNPYEENEKSKINIGLYCETVIGKRKPFEVPYALNSETWKDNPDVALNMVSYYGLPILWPDGEVFGTYCILDDKAHSYSSEQKELMQFLKENIENNLMLLYERDYYKTKVENSERTIKEIHHRIKNSFNMVVSLIRLEHDELEHDHKSLHEISESLQAKILGMSKVHDKLSRLESLEKVSLKNYINDLIEINIDIYGDVGIQFQVDIPEVYIPEKKLISCGLILNELLTNSIKHAFAKSSSPEITIKGAFKTDKGLVIHYSDNGVGVELPFDFDQSLGLSLTKGLAEDIGDGIFLIANKPCQFEFNIII